MMYTHKNLIKVCTLLFFLGVCVLYPLLVTAVTYQQGETLDPNCLPTDANCTVATSTISEFSVFNNALFGATATSSFNSIGELVLSAITSCTTLGTDSNGTVECHPGQDSVDVTKSADESRVSSDVLADDAELSFVIGANETWVFQFNLIYTTSATPDIQLAVTAPVGATCNYTGGSIRIADSSGSSTCGGAIAMLGASSVTNVALYSYGTVVNGSSAGTVRLQWAQNTSNSNTTTVHQGSAVSAFRISGGADIAEVYYSKDISLSSGTVVTLDPTLPGGVRRATLRDEPVGIVSTKPDIVIGDTFGAQSGAPILVALVGRVPVQVTTENGGIYAGDYLTLSSVPGVAMKAKGASRVIGRAMSAYDDEGTGTVVMFVRNSYFANAAPFPEDTVPSTDIFAIQSENAHDPVFIITRKISDGLVSFANFVAARVTAIRGYFDEIFARKVHSNELCLKKSDGREVCLDGDQLEAILHIQ